MNLYQLIYQSQSLVPFEMPELTNLLHRFRTSNQRLRITGFLLYTPDGRFLQVLEGDREAVRNLYYRRIVTDPHHHLCRVIGEGPCAHRSFADWSMGFRTAQAHDLRTLLGHVPANNLVLLVPRPHTVPETLKLLLEFVANSDPTPELDCSGTTER